MVHKPVISYIATRGMTPIDTPVVQKKLSKTEYCNWKNKQEFIDFVDSLYVPPKSTCYVYVKCHCGREYVYEDKFTIPDNNFTCVCDRKIIEYG
jgi:hypothetical protein